MLDIAFWQPKWKKKGGGGDGDVSQLFLTPPCVYGKDAQVRATLKGPSWNLKPWNQ